MSKKLVTHNNDKSWFTKELRVLRIGRVTRLEIEIILLSISLTKHLRLQREVIRKGSNNISAVWGSLRTLTNHKLWSSQAPHNPIQAK